MTKITSRLRDFSREMTQTEIPKIISKKELAETLGKSSSTITRMIEDGRLPKPLRTPNGNNGGWFSDTLHDWFHQHLKI